MDDITTTLGVVNTVKERYGSIARLVLEQGERTSCCGESACCEGTASNDPITAGLYADGDVRDLPEEAVLASLGCGNPTALASLAEGEIVLDLGSGGGIDVLLSAKRVGPTGFAYGLDMTDEMLELAERNRQKSGVTNVRFLKGTIEDVPLPDSSVDVIISNCVINLAADKDRVVREAYRVLKPGGRLAVSDIVWRRPLPDSIRRSADLWAGCIAGALLESEYIEKLVAAGFERVSITPTRVYTLRDMQDLIASDQGRGQDPALSEALEDAMMSAFIRAEKPTS